MTTQDDPDDDLPPDENVYLVLVRYAGSEHWSPWSAHDTQAGAESSAKAQGGRVFKVPIYGVDGPVLRRTDWPRSQP